MPSALFSTPRPEPNHLLPAAASAIVVVLALPVFLLAGWSVAGWGLAAVLWVGVHAIDVVLHRTRGNTGNLAASGVQAFGLLFKSLGLLVVLVATAVANPHLAIAAALTYALAYTLELGLSLATYFGGAK
ncbi:MAG TPA: hypothetical protein VFA56_13120 [Gaiellaceae bacterium]|nr:hypothetical protein [Gaiellaceae bacterium]